jgi:predicted RecA/RadA family phage recombinase
MALNEIFRDADSLSYNFGSVDPNISSGEFVTLSAAAPGALYGVAETDAVEREDGNFWATIRHVGVFEGETAVTGAIARGALLYIAAASAPSSLTVTNDAAAGANFVIGRALEAKGTTSGTVKIKVRVNN